VIFLTEKGHLLDLIFKGLNSSAAGFNFFDAGGFKSAQPHCMKAELLLLTL